jgi:hypothetical protein
MFVCAGLLGPIGLVVTLGLAGRIAPRSEEQLKTRTSPAGGDVTTTSRPAV